MVTHYVIQATFISNDFGYRFNILVNMSPRKVFCYAFEGKFSTEFPHCEWIPLLVGQILGANPCALGSGTIKCANCRVFLYILYAVYEARLPSRYFFLLMVFRFLSQQVAISKGVLKDDILNAQI